MIVRKMLIHEIDVTVNLFNYYRDEAVETIPSIADEYDEDAVLDTIRNYNIQYDHCWLNLYDNQRPVGFVAGYIVAKPWSKTSLIANLQFIYVLKSHRNLEVFKQLVNEFETWARQFNVKQITAGDIGIDIERSEKLYEHLGYTKELAVSKDIA